MQSHALPHEAAAAKTGFPGWGCIETRVLANIGSAADAIAFEFAKNLSAVMDQHY